MTNGQILLQFYLYSEIEVYTVKPRSFDHTERNLSAINLRNDKFSRRSMWGQFYTLAGWIFGESMVIVWVTDLIRVTKCEILV